MAQNIINNRMEMSIYSGTIPDGSAIVSIPSISPPSGKVFSTTVATSGVHFSRVQRADQIFMKRFRIYCDLNAFGAQIHNNTENSVEFLLKNEAVNDGGNHLKIVSSSALNEWIDVNSLVPASVESNQLDRRIYVNFAGTNLIIPSLRPILGNDAVISVTMQIEIAHTLDILGL